MGLLGAVAKSLWSSIVLAMSVAGCKGNGGAARWCVTLVGASAAVLEIVVMDDADVGSDTAFLSELRFADCD